MWKNKENRAFLEKFSDKSFINFLKVFLNDLLFRSIPVTHDPPTKLMLSEIVGEKGNITYYKLKLELNESNVFKTKSICFEWKPNTKYEAEINKGPLVPNQTMDKLRSLIRESDHSLKRDPTIRRSVEDPNENIKHKDIILGLTCCIRIYGKKFNFTRLQEYIPAEIYKKLQNTSESESESESELESESQILIDRTTIIGLLWTIAQMRKPSIFDSISKSLFKEYFESSIPIEAQNLIYILALGRRLEVLTPEKIENSMQNLSSPELLNSLSVNDWIIALSCMDKDDYQIVTKIMNLIVEEINGMDINSCVACLSAMICIKASPKRYQLSYRNILTRIDNIFSFMPVNQTMSHLIHLTCQIECDMKGFFESICTKVILIMHLMPIFDMVKLMCGIAIYSRNCEKIGGVCQDITRIPSFVKLENHVITKIISKPPFPKELLDLIHDSLIVGSKFVDNEDFDKLMPNYKIQGINDKSVNKNNNARDLFRKKNSVELDNEKFELSSQERIFFANLLEDCCNNINKLDSDVIMELVYSMLTFKVNMKPLAMAVKRLVDESVLQEISKDKMGFSVNLSSEMSDVVYQYKLAESIINYANRGKNVKDKFEFIDTQKQLESSFGVNDIDRSKSSSDAKIPTIENSSIDDRSVCISKNSSKSKTNNEDVKESECIKDSKPKFNIIKDGVKKIKISSDVVVDKESKSILPPNRSQRNRNFSVNNKRECADSVDNVCDKYINKNVLDSDQVDVKRDERNPVVQTRRNVSESVAKSNANSGNEKVTNVKVSSNILSSGKNKSVYGKFLERVESANNSIPINQSSINNHPQYSSGVNVLTNQNFKSHPQYSTHNQGPNDHSYSLHPQFTRSPQHKINPMYMNNQHQNMINHTQGHRELMYNPTYGNYQNYYSGGSNNMNHMVDNVHNNSNNVYSNNNDQVYQVPTTIDMVSNVRYNTIDASNPHISNLSPNPNYGIYNKQHFIDPHIHVQPLNTQQQNITYPRHDNDCLSNPSISDLKNQIHLLELEIEKERLKDLERKLAYMKK